MNKFSQKGLRSLKSRLTRRLLFQYCLSLLIYAVLLVLAFIASYLIATSSRIWYLSDFWYYPLKIIEVIFIPGGGFLGWAVITYHFISKPLGYLDEMVSAAEELAEPTDKPITLPMDLKDIQDELNQVREQSIRNAYLARESEQRKNDLIVYLAHDLKTPLTSVVGYLNLLQDEPQISEQLRNKYIGIALNKALRLEDLINEFFDITRFNLTTLTLEPERINLSRMTEQIASEFYPVLAEKDLHWKLNIQPDIELVCDPDKLARVYDNLIRNAVNYSYAGTEILLTLQKIRGGVKLYLCNHGKTISPDKLERIFDQFFRLDSSRSSATGGAGLGLAITKQIVELHGGQIRAGSEDESIFFTVFLPDHISTASAHTV